MFISVLLVLSAPQAMGGSVTAPFQLRLLVLPTDGTINTCGQATVGLSATSGIAVECMPPPVPGSLPSPQPVTQVGSGGLVRLGDGPETPTLFPGFGVIDRFYTIRPGLVERELMVAF